MDTLRILVLDDEEAIRESLVGYLEDFGFGAIPAESAERAIEILEEREVDAAIVDLRLPGMSGEEFLHIAHRRWPGVIYVIYTGSPHYNLAKSFSAAERISQTIFLKPLEDLSRLVEEIQRIFAARQPEGS